MTPSTPSHVLQRLGDVRGWQEDFYRDPHAHPELSHQETRTAAKVADRLRAAGCEVHAGVGGTGVVAILRSGEGPAVLLRADMDALPIREVTGLPYASKVTDTGPDGTELPVMHACGHDVHVTCLLGAVGLLADATADWHGTVGRGVPARRRGRRWGPGNAGGRCGQDRRQGRRCLVPTCARIAERPRRHP